MWRTDYRFLRPLGRYGTVVNRRRNGRMKGPRFPASARCAKGPAGVANVQRVSLWRPMIEFPSPPWLMRSRLRPRLLVGNDVAYHPPNPDYPPTVRATARGYLASRIDYSMSGPVPQFPLWSAHYYLTLPLLFTAGINQCLCLSLGIWTIVQATLPVFCDVTSLLLRRRQGKPTAIPTR